MSRTPDEEPIDLAPLAPSETWVAGLPALGAEAARGAPRDLGARLGRSARWFVPMAAASAAACWLVAARAAPPSAPGSSAAILGAGTDADLARALMLSGGSR